MRDCLTLGGHLLDQIVDRGFHFAKEAAGIKPDPEYANHQRQQHQPFPPVDIDQLLVLRIVAFAENDALVHPEHIDRSENHSASSDNSIGDIHLERTEQNQELTHETIGAGQANRREHHDHKEGGKYWHHRENAAEILNQSRVTPFVDHADDQEERASGDAMIDHLQQRPLQTHRVESEHADHHEAHVRY